jgi:hypothetical protein
MRLLIGIDDTDNLDSRGTGYKARCLGTLLEETGLAQVEGITRHQLLVDPRIPYTSHNSSACLVVNTKQNGLAQLADYCRDYLLKESASGSDAGLCLASWPAVRPVIQRFGYQAKQQVLTAEMAINLTLQENILLAGLTGTGGGVIGALAAVGLRASGEDGRFLWLPGLRELDGIYTAERLQQMYRIDKIMSLDNTTVLPEARIDVGDWSRPILRQGQAVLLVEEVKDHDQCNWRVAPREIVKQF